MTNLTAFDLRIGDTVEYGGVTVDILGSAQPHDDIFGRKEWRLWARRRDTMREGWLYYGFNAEPRKAAA